MPDYSQGKIYRIYSPSHLEVGHYIGSTTQPLSKRMDAHRSTYRKYQATKVGFITSFIILDFEDARIELIEDCPCENKEHLNRREGELIRATENCVNKQIAGRTKAEFLREWRAKNHERYLENQRRYRAENPDVVERERERERLHYAEHREEIREEENAKRRENAEYYRERERKWYEENKERIRARRRAYYEAHKEEMTRKKREYIERKKAEASATS